VRDESDVRECDQFAAALGNSEISHSCEYKYMKFEVKSDGGNEKYRVEVRIESGNGK
jgi:hypothetical protein